LVLVTVQAKTLAAALDFLSGAIAKNTAIPVLTSVKIEAGDGLTVTTTNLDVLLSAEAKSTVENPGAVCAPHGRLSGLIAALPPDAEVALRLEDNRLSIKSGSGHWRLPTFDPLDFPVIDSIAAGAATFTLPGAEARRLIKRAEHAISGDMRRFNLTGLHVTHRSGKVIVVGLDGYRLVEATSASVDLGLIPPVTLPRKIVETLDAIAGAGDVTVRLTDRLVELAAGGLACRSKLIDASFPDYGRAIPNPSKNVVVVEAAPVLAAVERLVAVAGGLRQPSRSGSSGLTAASRCVYREHLTRGRKRSSRSASTVLATSRCRAAFCFSTSRRSTPRSSASITPAADQRFASSAPTKVRPRR
jgi:DNA polymerase-3 subunit beta